MYYNKERRTLLGRLERHGDSGGAFGGSAAKSLHYMKACGMWNWMMGNESEGWVLMQALPLTRQVALSK